MWEIIVDKHNRENGIKVYPAPSSLLSKGRDGLRFMCIPFYYDKI